MAKESANFADEQLSYYAGAIGRGARQEILNDLYDYVKDAKPPEIYSSHSEVRFIYEILFKEGWKDRVRELVDLWVENEANIRRAAEHVQRHPQLKGSALVVGFCIFRLKGVEGQEWATTPDGLGIDEREPQTIVFIALENLNPSNGFFISLEHGEDVCVDSKAEVRFPPTGGGLGICIGLDM